MKILYITSFNEKLYEASGKQMLQSFVEHKIDGDLLVTYEGFYEKFESLYSYNLDNDEWLRSWTEKNADVIPQKYGGKLVSDTWDKDIKSKYGTSFNHQAARWFRKIVSLRHACDVYLDYDIIICCDCDSIFEHYLPSSHVEEIIGDNAMMYHLGLQRKFLKTGIEAGFIGWQMKAGGLDFLNIVFNLYETGEFRNLERWDDGWIFRYVMELHPEIKCKDLVPPHIMDTRAGNVIEYGPFAKYFIHNKGKHQRLGIVQ